MATPPLRFTVGVLLALLTATGCAQTLGYTECGASCSAADLQAGKCDGECLHLGSDGGAGFCTSDHLCVSPLPAERLCSGSAGAPPAPGNLVVASLVNRTDPQDRNIERAFLLAVNEINKLQQGASQPPIELHLCDTASDPTQALRAAHLAVERYHAVAFLGPSTSDAALQVTAYVRAQGVLLITPSATAVDLSAVASDHLVWRTVPSDALQAKLLARVVKLDSPAPTPDGVDALYVDTVYGKGVYTAFDLELRKVTATTLLVKDAILFHGPADLTAAVNKLSADGPSHALLVADTDAPALVRAISKDPGHGLDQTHFFLTDAAKVDALFGPPGMRIPAALLARIRGTAPAEPKGPDFDLFNASYKATYGIDAAQSAFTANAYDAAYLVAVAASATSGHLPNGHELAAGLARIKSCDHSSANPNVDVLGRDYLRALRDLGKGSLCASGASGPIEFDANDDPVYGDYEYWGIDTSNPATPVFTRLPIPSSPM